MDMCALKTCMCVYNIYKREAVNTLVFHHGWPGAEHGGFKPSISGAMIAVYCIYEPRCMVQEIL